MKRAIIYTCVWSTFAMIASYTIGPQLVHMVTGSHKDVVIVNATNYLKFNTIFYYVTAVISIVRNVMQGIGDQITPLVSSGLEMVGNVVIAFTLVPLMGYAGAVSYTHLDVYKRQVKYLIKLFVGKRMKNRNI